MSSLALLEPQPQSLWPLAWLQAAEVQGSAQAFGVISFAFPSGTVHLATEDYSDDDLGEILGRVSAWPLFHLGFDPTSFSLSLPEYRVDFDDKDGALADIFEGGTSRSVFRIPVTVRACTPALASASWPIHWTGILARWSVPSTGIIRVILTHDDGWLRAPLARHRVNPPEWAYAHETARGKVLPLAVGTFDSRLAPEEVPGAVPALYLDTRTTERLFVPILGAAKQVSRVWIAGAFGYANDPGRYPSDWTEAVLDTDYDVTIETISGYDVTCIRWLVDPITTVDPDATGIDELFPVVRCDLVGHESEGDGSGFAIEGPLAGLRHLLLLGWSSWRSGAYPDRTTGPLDLETWAEVDDYLSGNLRRLRNRANTWTSGRRPSLYVGDDRRAVDVLNDACRELGIRPYCNEAGKVALAVIDHRRKRTYFDAEFWIRDEDLTGGITNGPGRQRLRDKLEAGAISVKDLSVSWDATERLRARLSGQEVSDFDLVPYVTTQDSGFVTIGADPHDDVDDPPYSPDEAVTMASWEAASATGTFRVRARLSAAPQIPQGHAIVAVEIGHRSRYEANGGGTHTAKAGVWVGGAPFYGPGGDIVLTTDWADYSEMFPVNPNSTDPWTLEDIGPDLLELIFSATHTASLDRVQVTSVFARVYVADGGPAAGLMRERLSAELLLSRRPIKVLEARVGLHRAGIRPGDYFSVSSPNVVAPALTAGGGQGWGIEWWQRRLHVMCLRQIDWNRQEARITGLDARDLLVPWWETGQASTLAPIAGEIVRLGGWLAGRAGQVDGREFSRITEDDGSPVGQDSITAPNGETVTIEADHERYTDQGLVVEPASGGVSADLLVIRSCHDAQAWDVEGGGTAVFLLRCPTTGAGQLTIFRCGSDKLFFTIAATNQVRYTRVVGATTYTSTLNASALTPGDPLVIAIRWTTGIGGLTRLDEDEFEEEIPPFSLDSWLRQGAVDERAAAVVAEEGYNGHLYLLSNAGTELLGPTGAFLHGRVWRQLLTDEEVESEMEALLS